MKVYLVEVGYAYEGGCVERVFSTRELADAFRARWEAHSELDPDCPEATDDAEWEQYDLDRKAWNEAGAGWFRNGDYCSVSEFEVDARACM